MPKRNILFIHSVYPSQFDLLHRHLNENGLANSYYLCGQSFYDQHSPSCPNLYPFQGDGNYNENLYFYSGIAESTAKLAIGIKREAEKILQQVPIDLIVAHGTLGPPNFLFHKVKVPIITYIEFPSYRHHGWDPQYPPTKEYLDYDKNFEMISFFQALTSDLVIMPSHYSKKMFPEKLHDNIKVQMEGFDPKKLDIRRETPFFEKEPNTTYIGYTARTLSSEKGFEQFIKISKAILTRDQNVKFVIIGASKGASYGFENGFLKEKYGEQEVTFKDHVIAQENIDQSKYIFIESLNYEDFAACVNEVDIFLYPLQFGSANWGIYELLLRGKIVVASNRCFIPEIIEHEKNGFICDYDNIEQWAETVDHIIKEKERYKHIGENAKEYCKQFYIEKIAPQYLDIFEDVIRKYKACEKC